MRESTLLACSCLVKGSEAHSCSQAVCVLDLRSVSNIQPSSYKRPKSLSSNQFHIRLVSGLLGALSALQSEALHGFSLHLDKKSEPVNC